MTTPAERLAMLEKLAEARRYSTLNESIQYAGLAARIGTTGILETFGIQPPAPPRVCDLLSPDGDLACQLKLEHVGLHDHRGATWYGGQWFTPPTDPT